MSTSIYTSTPRQYALGVKDESVRSVDIEAISLPQHLPWVPLFAPTGDGVPTVLRGNGAIKKYGSDAFDVTSKYATHFTPFMNKFIDVTNPMLMQRLIPADATKAMLRVSVEAIPNEMPVYERNDDGSIKYTANDYNERLPTVKTTIVGTRLVVHVGVTGYGSNGSTTNPINYQLFGNGVVVRDFRANTTLGTDGKQLGVITDATAPYSSTLYPVFDLEYNSEGERGNDFGVRLQLPISTGASPIDTASVYANNAYMWRMGVVSKNTVTGGYDVVSTVNGETSVDVALKATARSDRFNLPLAIDAIWLNSYILPATDVTPEFAGSFGKMHFYRDSVEELQKLLISGNGHSIGESTYNDEAKLGWGRVPLTAANSYLLNFLGGYDVDGASYFTFSLADSANFGGVTITMDNVIYASGGTDGLKTTASGENDELANYELFDSLVRAEMANFGDGTVQWLNTARYPVSTFWDSGFSVDTKKAMLTPLGKRKDVAVILATQSVADYVTTNAGGKITKVWSWVPPNNEAEETSLAGSLRTLASSYPESEVYGTSVCRAIIVGQCGTLINSNYTRKLPLTYELAAKVAYFMGDANGVWRDDGAYDVKGNNKIEFMKDINLSWKNENVANQAWANGLVYAEDYDIKSLFFPAVRTVYNNDTSVLNSSITMFAICFIERVCQGAWRDLVGNAKWTQAKFKQESNQIIADRLNNVFDGRFIISVDTFFTQADSQRGFSYGCKVYLYAPNMKTVGQYTIVAQRIDDYNANTVVGQVVGTTATA
ncbi:MAG: hypothetical protein [Bacteriophage sp.]|nr:MAG: hypothetical protein [Bacteriophage sp.]